MLIESLYYLLHRFLTYFMPEKYPSDKSSSFKNSPSRLFL